MPSPKGQKARKLVTRKRAVEDSTGPGLARLSAPALNCEGRNSKAANQGKQPACDQCRRFGTSCPLRAVNGREEAAAKAGLLRPQPDRKSTRLNSSHMSI